MQLLLFHNNNNNDNDDNNKMISRFRFLKVRGMFKLRCERSPLRFDPRKSNDEDK